MSRPSATLVRPTMPPEVHSFATKQGVSRYLPAIVALAEEAFPSAAVVVSLSHDAEEEGHRYIALDVEVGDLPSEALLAGQRAWSSGLTRVCPSRDAVFFVLGWR